jgi:PhnB protein
MAVKPIPEEYTRVTPVLITDGAASLIEFLQQVFGAQERLRMPMPDGKIGHAELSLGDSVIMVADPMPNFGAMAGFLHIYVEDVDRVYQRALSAGATSDMEPTNEFYGDRVANVTDPFGNRYSISTHVEDVSDEEMMKRVAEYTASAVAGA